MIGDYLVISYYRDGVIIVDVSDPANMVEVGQFDTSPFSSAPGFQGCWGAYPYLSSGNILATDRQEGLFVLSPNYVEACRVKYKQELQEDFDAKRSAPARSLTPSLSFLI